MKAIIDTGRMGDQNITDFLTIAKTHPKVKVYIVLSQYYVAGSAEDIQAFLDEAGIKLL